MTDKPPAIAARPIARSFRLGLLLSVAGCTLGQPPGHIPEWASDAVWYQIFPERFRNGDLFNEPTRDSLVDPNRAPRNWRVMNWRKPWNERASWEQAASPRFADTLLHRRYGGDLQGVIHSLDYLCELGVNALYFNPIFYSPSHHKYDGSSFHHIDPYFGPDPQRDLAIIRSGSNRPEQWHWTTADQLFLQLLREAKSRDMRVIIDGVWNHTGRDFFAFQDILQKQHASPYASWYKIESFDDPDTPQNEFNYTGWHGYKSLPEFARTPDGQNLAPGPRQYIFQATRRWMDPNGDGDPADGIDGWRLDVSEEIPAGFWQDWHQLVREINPQAFTAAEIWGPSAKFIEANGFSSAMNYRGFAIPVKGWLIDGRIPASAFAAYLRKERTSRTPQAARALQNLVDSHDTQRVASAIVNRHQSDRYDNPDWFDYDDPKYVSAQSEHYKNQPPGPQGRRIWKMLALFQATYIGAPMLYYGTEIGMWGADDPDDRKPAPWHDIDREILLWYQQALALRQDCPPLRRGDFTLLEADDTRQLFVFERALQDRRMVIAINRGESPASLHPQYMKGQTLRLATDPEANNKTLPGLSAAVYTDREPAPDPEAE